MSGLIIETAQNVPILKEHEGQFLENTTNYWQKVLNIEHWRIKLIIVANTKLPNALMEIAPTRARSQATIFIKYSTLKKIPLVLNIEGSNSIEFDKLLVHELVHLIYDPLAEEQSLEMSYVCDSKSRQEEYKERYTQILEKAVEHTAQLICKNIKGV